MVPGGGVPAVLNLLQVEFAEIAAPGAVSAGFAVVDDTGLLAFGAGNLADPVAVAAGDVAVEKWHGSVAVAGGAPDPSAASARATVPTVGFVAVAAAFGAGDIAGGEIGEAKAEAGACVLLFYGKFGAVGGVVGRFDLQLMFGRRKIGKNDLFIAGEFSVDEDLRFGLGDGDGQRLGALVEQAGAGRLLRGNRDFLHDVGVAAAGQSHLDCPGRHLFKRGGGFAGGLPTERVSGDERHAVENRLHLQATLGKRGAEFIRTVAEVLDGMGIGGILPTRPYKTHRGYDSKFAQLDGVARPRISFLGVGTIHVGDLLVIEGGRRDAFGD